MKAGALKSGGVKAGSLKSGAMKGGALKSGGVRAGYFEGRLPYGVPYSIWCFRPSVFSAYDTWF